MPGHPESYCEIPAADNTSRSEQGAHSDRLSDKERARGKHDVLVEMESLDVQGPAHPFRGQAHIKADQTCQKNSVADQMQDLHAQHRAARRIGGRCDDETDLVNEIHNPWRHPRRVPAADVRPVAKDPHAKLERVLREMANLENQAKSGNGSEYKLEICNFGGLGEF